MSDDILAQDLASPQLHWFVKNDTMHGEDPVLFPLIRFCIKQKT